MNLGGRKTGRSEEFSSHEGGGEEEAEAGISWRIHTREREILTAADLGMATNPRAKNVPFKNRPK
jgi:hypothetical protein